MLAVVRKLIRQPEMGGTGLNRSISESAIVNRKSTIRGLAIGNRPSTIVNPEVRVFDGLEQLSWAAATRLKEQAPSPEHFGARRP